MLTLPNFSDPAVQYDTLIYVLTFLGGAVGMRIPKVAAVLNKILGFLKAFQPVPKPAVSAAEVPATATTLPPVPNLPTDDHLCCQAELPPVDHASMVLMCNDMSKFFLDAQDQDSLNLVSQIYNRLHRLPAVE